MFASFVKKMFLALLILSAVYALYYLAFRNEVSEDEFGVPINFENQNE